MPGPFDSPLLQGNARPTLRRARVRARATGRALRLGLLLSLATTSGCGTAKTQEQYIPAADIARAAVEAALVDWKNGNPPGALEGIKPVGHLVDTHRKPGQTLEAFEILGELAAETTRCFAVRVRLNNPAADERLRFCVVGIDPLWVFRQEDYDNLAHWDHPMPSPPDGPSAVKAATEESPPREPLDAPSEDSTGKDSPE